MSSEEGESSSCRHLNKVTVNICAGFGVDTAFQVIWVHANVLWQIQEQLQGGKIGLSSQGPMLADGVEQWTSAPSNLGTGQR